MSDLLFLPSIVKKSAINGWDAKSYSSQTLYNGFTLKINTYKVGKDLVTYVRAIKIQKEANKIQIESFTMFEDFHKRAQVLPNKRVTYDVLKTVHDDFVNKRGAVLFEEAELFYKNKDNIGTISIPLQILK